MVEKIKQKITSFKKVAGIEATIKGDGTTDYCLIVLSMSKNVVTIEVKESGIQDIEKVKSLVPAETPIALTVNGRGILHKKITEASFTNNAEVISNVLPNAKVADFYLQKIHSGKNVFVSVIRKDSFHKIAALFESHNLPVIYASCGPFIVADIVPFLEKNIDEIAFSGYSLTLKNNFISDYKVDAEKKENSYLLGDERVSSTILSSYASAFHLLINSSNNGLDSDQIKAVAEEFKNKMIFKIAGYSILCFFVGLMLLNYLIYNYYKSENSELSGRSQIYGGMVKEIEQLEKQVKEKEYFLKSAGWLSVPRTSFFADQIAGTIPSSIKLSDIRINPLNNNQSKRQKKKIFQSDTIYVSGTCSNPTVLNPWMKELKSMEWVEEANNINYTHDHKTKAGSFEVEIKVSDEF